MKPAIVVSAFTPGLAVIRSLGARGVPVAVMQYGKVVEHGGNIDGIRQAEISHITAMVEDGTVNAWRVKIRVTFAVQEQLHE